MRREDRRIGGGPLLAALAAVAALVLGPDAVRAQPMMGGGAGGMPDLHAIVGKALPDRGMATGTVSVRVARKVPGNGVGAAEVTAIIKNAGGDLRKRTAKTDASGRTMFEGLVPGDQFRAEVTVDGERLVTDDFTLPAQGGIRTMLIAALGPAPAGQASRGAGAGAGAAGGEGADFNLGASTGTSKPDPSLPSRTLVVHILDEAGKPIANHPVTLGAVDQNNKIETRKGQSDAGGVARFSDLPTGPGTGYAAVIEWHGMRIGTEPFAMPDSGGVRAEIRAMARTSDPSVITVGGGGRLILQMREDAMQFLEILPLENSSDKMFDPGPGAVEIPLPQGFIAAEASEAERKVEVRQNHGIAVHGTITPKRALAGSDAKTAGNEVTFGFVLPYHGDSKDFEQPMPNGMGPLALITEQLPGLAITGRGVGPRESRELGGRKYWVAAVEAIPAGGVLKLAITGLPATDSTGRTVAGGLALALIAGAFAFSRRPRDQARRAASDERERLTARREALFSELVAVEQSGRAGKSAETPQRRRDLVAQLEGVYQQLAGLDEQRAL